MRTPFTTCNGGTTPADSPWTVHFCSEDGYEDWDVAGSEGELHTIYQDLGSPYTVTTYQQAPVWEDDEAWYQPSPLTTAERNPSLT